MVGRLLVGGSVRGCGRCWRERVLRLVVGGRGVTFWTFRCGLVAKPVVECLNLRKLGINHRMLKRIKDKSLDR